MAKDKKCKDNNCPFHGSLKTRGRGFVGTVKSDKMSRTITIEFERMFYLPKYERYERRRTRLKAHNPDCIDGLNNRHLFSLSSSHVVRAGFYDHMKFLVPLITKKEISINDSPVSNIPIIIMQA